MHRQVIANFSASWCGPCKVVAPFYSELSEKYPSLMFLVVDVDELTVSNERIYSNSFFIFFLVLVGCFCQFEHSSIGKILIIISPVDM